MTNLIISNYSAKIGSVKILLPLLTLCLLSGCSDFCGNTISQMLVSPDGKLKAVVFQRDCGATTGFSTQISVLAVNETLPNDGGNVFVENTGNSVKVEWQGNARLHIYHKPTPFASKKQISIPQNWFRHDIVQVEYDLETAESVWMEADRCSKF